MAQYKLFLMITAMMTIQIEADLVTFSKFGRTRYTSNVGQQRDIFRPVWASSWRVATFKVDLVQHEIFSFAWMRGTGSVYRIAISELYDVIRIHFRNGKFL